MTDVRLLNWKSEDSIIVREPMERGPGHWVGAPSVLADGNEVYMTFRYRRPRGQGRGFEARIARSRDGVHFEDIWSVRQSALATSSMERFALVRGPSGYLLYLSYVDPTDRRWCIDVVTAEKPDQFNVDQRHPVLRAGSLGLEAVKDPVVFLAQGLYWMYVSCAVRSESALNLDHHTLHQSEDVYTTGQIHSQTGLAVSRDGVHYHWLGIVLTPTPGGWDAYAARVSGLLRWDGGVLAFYDGGATVDDNYEEKTGLALVSGWDRLIKLSVDGPWWISPFASGSLRYLATAQRDGHIDLYYEAAEADGSHGIHLMRLSG